MSEPTVKRMWDGGPLREWSETRPSPHWIPYGKGGYVNSYYCEHCQRPVPGVYQVQSRWICGTCKAEQKPKAAEHEQRRVKAAAAGR